MSVAERDAVRTYPIPPGRGLWRFTLHWRKFAPGPLQAICEFTSARSRKLDLSLNSPADLSFTINGLAPEAQLITELAQEVIAWRWDNTLGRDVAMFRGPICQAQDQLTEQSYTINITCHDYLAVMNRRITTRPTPYVISQWDQDDIAAYLVTWARQATAAGGAYLTPGSYLPLDTELCAPDGTVRAKTGILRDRNYPGQTNLYEALSNLAAVINGFDYDVQPNTDGGADFVRIFYPEQGIERSHPSLVYGSTVSTVDRTVNSGDYANYCRVVGNNGSEDPNADQMYSESYNADATNGTQGAVGLWMNADNAADVSIKSTLDQQVAGTLQTMGVLVPSYSLGLRPGWWWPGWNSPDQINMGDAVPLIIRKGRLNINTTIRVVGITYDIGDDGQEDVSLTVGRPDVTFADLLVGPIRDVNALARR